MGIQINPLRLMIEAKLSGIGFDKVLMIGRLNVFVADDILEKVLVQYGLKPPTRPPLYPPSDRKRYADSLFRLIGAKSVDALDYSAYEGATLLHDMNRPLPPSLEGQFDVVVEGGTIEHVFNFPVALQNCMRAVKTGGRLFICQMANNFCGHGFYNFSPELFYRVLDAKYGYRVEHMLVYECNRPDRIFQVADPARVRERVQIKCSYGTILLIQACRITPGNNLLTDPPQQSDYVAAWEEVSTPRGEEGRSKPSLAVFRQMLHRVPWLYQPYCRFKIAQNHRKLRRRAHFGDPNWFKPFHFVSPHCPIQ